MLGIPYERPAAYTRDYLEVLHAAFANPGPVDVENGTFRVHNPLDLGPVAPLPVLVAALGPVMLTIAGERADGTVLWMADERAIGEHIAPRINKAADNAGHDRDRLVAPPKEEDDIGRIGRFRDPVQHGGEDHDGVVLDAQFMDPRQEAFAISLALVAHEMGMRRAKDDIDGIRLAFAYQGHRIDHDLDPLVRRDEPECQDDRFSPKAAPLLGCLGADERAVRNAVRNHLDLAEFLKYFPFDCSLPREEKQCWADTVRAHYKTMLYRGQALPTTSALAAALGISSATLRRRLDDEKSSIRAIKEQARMELALQYLDRSTLSIDELAAHLDFSSSKAFTRAFKSWKGMTPAHYREVSARSERVAALN